jgi:hypothetical protein
VKPLMNSLIRLDGSLMPSIKSGEFPRRLPFSASG